MKSARPTLGAVLLTRGPDGLNLLAGTRGTRERDMVQMLLSEVVSRGGSDHPKDWMAWFVDRVPDAQLLSQFEALVASGKGGSSHPAVVGTAFDARHPRMAT